MTTAHDPATATPQDLDAGHLDGLVAEAEHGYDVDQLLTRRRGRPPLGSAAATVESVRLDPELRRDLLLRAAADHTSVSTVIRDALRRYLTPAG